jgi:uncharacterized membrane protein
MTIKELLQGKHTGHPLHPAIVHIPTGLWPAALVFDLLSVAGVGGNPMVRTSFFAIALGLAAALAAVPTGLADFSEIKKDRPAWKLGLLHLLLNGVVAVLFLVNIILRWRTFDTAASVTGGQLTVTIIADVLLSVSGYLGGRMVYDYGIGVVRLPKPKRAWRSRAEAAGANLPPAKADG